MKFKIMPAQPGRPPAPAEPVLLFELRQHRDGVVVTALLEGDPKAETRYLLTIGERGIWRWGYARGLGLPTDEAGRVVDRTGKE